MDDICVLCLCHDTIIRYQALSQTQPEIDEFAFVYVFFPALKRTCDACLCGCYRSMRRINSLRSRAITIVFIREMYCPVIGRLFQRVVSISAHLIHFLLNGSLPEIFYVISHHSWTLSRLSSSRLQVMFGPSVVLQSVDISNSQIFLSSDVVYSPSRSCFSRSGVHL